MEEVFDEVLEESQQDTSETEKEPKMIETGVMTNPNTGTEDSKVMTFFNASENK